MSQGTENINKTLKVPLTLAGITPAWLSSVISKKVSSNNFKVTGNAQEGTGFLSQLVRISAEVETDHSGNSSNNEIEKQKLNLIVKVLPVPQLSEATDRARQIVIDEGFDVTEIKFYEIVLPDIVQELEELKAYLCPYVCGYILEDPRDSIIVLEDLKPLGYYNLNFAQEIPMPRIEETVRFMAKFHYAGSAIALRKQTPIEKLYPFLQQIPNDNIPLEASTFFNFNVEAILKLDPFFETQNCSEELRNAFKKILPGHKNMCKSIFKAMYNHPSMIHGDLWCNNILFTDNPNLTFKAIDWQLLGFGDAAYDLSGHIVSMLPASQLNRENVDKLLNIYLDTFEEYCVKNGLKSLITRSRKEFSDFFYTYAMGYVFLWFTYSQYPFSLNFPKLIGIYRFLYKDVDLIPFLLSIS